MRQFELRRSWRGKDIIAHVLVLDEGVHVSLYGGDKTHIGAVGIIDPDGNRAVTQFSGHREGLVCERWLDALAAANVKPAVVEAGIHYDGLDREGISEVLGVLEELLGDLLRMLNHGRCGGEGKDPGAVEQAVKRINFD